MTPRVSVVVPTYRRPDLLRRCLAALAAQDLAPHEYEIIVVDDASDDTTRRLVEGPEWAHTARRQNPAPPGRNGHGSRGDENNGRHTHGDGFSHAPQPETEVVRMSRPARGANQAWADGTKHGEAAHDEGGELRLGTGFAAGEALRQVQVVQAQALVEVRYLTSSGGHGPARARNLGWRAARGEIVAFTDDDCIPAPGWLRSGVAAFTSEVWGVSGRVVMPLDGVPTDYQRDATGLARSEFVTANCFYRRAALEAAGGFDERFTAAWREDTDLYFTLLNRFSAAQSADCRIRCTPASATARLQPSVLAPVQTVGSDGPFVLAADALVVHPIRPAPWGVSVRQQRKNFFNALLYKKHPALYRERIQPLPPLSYYASVAAGLTAVAGLTSGQPRWGLAAALVWGALTGRFCLQRLRGTVHRPAHVLEMAATSALIPPVAVFWRLAGAIRYRVPFL